MKKTFAVLLIVVAVLAAYAPAARNDFVWDDTALILRDPLIRSWRLIPEGFNHFLFVDATASDFYRPVQRLAYTVDYALFSFRPAGYHVVNILIHTGAALALLFLAEALLLAYGLGAAPSRWISILATLAWAIHPVHTAAVVYISGLADPLAALFGFLACYLMLRSRARPPRQTLFWLLGAVIAFLLAALSKESGLLFPLVATVIALTLRDYRALFKAMACSVVVATVYLSLRQPAEHNPSPPSSHVAPLATRPILMARALAEYAGLIVMPVNLHMDREVDARPGESTEMNMKMFADREMETWLGIVLLGGTIYWMLRAARQNSPAAKLLLLAGLAYLPISGLIALNAPVAEHWIYIPTAFLFLAVGVSLASLLEAKRPRPALLLGGSVVLACWMTFLAVRTCLRTFDWKDQRTFFERTIAAGGDSPRMLINLGGLELSERHLDQASVLLNAALKKEPDQPLAIINLAVVALRRNDYKTARQLALRATEMPWVDAQAHELIAVLDDKEKGQVNPLRLRLASRTGPPNWSIEKRYVRFLDETGATDAAIHELQTCLQTQWYRAESWQLLAKLLTKAGLVNEASAAQEKAMAYDVHLLDRSQTL